MEVEQLVYPKSKASPTRTIAFIRLMKKGGARENEGTLTRLEKAMETANLQIRSITESPAAFQGGSSEGDLQ